METQKTLHNYMLFSAFGIAGMCVCVCVCVCVHVLHFSCSNKYVVILYHGHYLHFHILLLGRKVMTNLDSVLKSRDITLPTKVHLVKAMVFPVVMYGCESWTVKKGEC